jgi:hypothetical protein
MTWSQAEAIGNSTEWKGKFLPRHSCNPNTHKWFLDLAVDMAGCKPALMIDTETKATEVNNRCTGAIPVK